VDRARSLVRPSADLLPWYAALTGIVSLAAAYLVVSAPEDAVQGIVQKIFYLHVPAAIAAYACFGVVLLGGVVYLWKESASFDRLARVAAEVGLLFTTITLVMGSIWAKPIWGTYWVPWDARLVSTLVLWLIYLAYGLVRRVGGPGRQTARFAAVVGIVGFVDVPVVHYSVDWFRTIHPPLVAAQPDSLPGQMLPAFVVSICAVLLFAGLLVWLRYRLELRREGA
jgi:heme exporter protein C